MGPPLPPLTLVRRRTGAGFGVPPGVCLAMVRGTAKTLAAFLTPMASIDTPV